MRVIFALHHVARQLAALDTHDGRNQIENATFIFTLVRILHISSKPKKNKKQNNRIACDKYFMKMLCRR